MTGNDTPFILPIVITDDELYFYDDKLKQLRNVENPHDFIDLMADSKE